MSDIKKGDPEFLRRVASEMRAHRDLRGALELERIARILEGEPPQDHKGNSDG